MSDVITALNIFTHSNFIFTELFWLGAYFENVLTAPSYGKTFSSAILDRLLTCFHSGKAYGQGFPIVDMCPIFFKSLKYCNFNLVAHTKEIRPTE